MPRRPGVFIDGGTYHVHCRASRDEVVFADQSEAASSVGVPQKVTEDGRREVRAAGP
jgi:hypothetical protein